jgi:hypothetical protein
MSPQPRPLVRERPHASESHSPARSRTSFLPCSGTPNARLSSIFSKVHRRTRVTAASESNDANNAVAVRRRALQRIPSEELIAELESRGDLPLLSRRPSSAPPIQPSTSVDTTSHRSLAEDADLADHRLLALNGIPSLDDADATFTPAIPKECALYRSLCAGDSDVEDDQRSTGATGDAPTVIWHADAFATPNLCRPQASRP